MSKKAKQCHLWVILSLALLVLYLVLTPASNANNVDPSFRQIVHSSSSLCSYPNRIGFPTSGPFRTEQNTSCPQACLAEEKCKYTKSQGPACIMYDTLPPFEEGKFTGTWLTDEGSSWAKPEAAGCVVDPNPKLSTAMQKPSVVAGPNQGEVTVTFIPLVGASNYLVTAMPLPDPPRYVQGSSSPIIFKDLDPSREYTFRVTGENLSGLSPASPASNPVQPKA